MKPAEPLLAPGAAIQRLVTGVQDEHPFERAEWLADEVPVALEFNGITHVVMLCTPIDLEDFALGFALTEGLLSSPDELYGIDESHSCDGITLKLEVSSSAFARLKERRRSMAGRTGCGLCGTDSLAQVRQTLPEFRAIGTEPAEPLSPAAVSHAMDSMKAMQALHHATGAVHAAAWCRQDGEIELLREDVGRHNALDKLIGAAARHGFQSPAAFIAVTSRASFEMVQKTAMAGVSTLAAISAPTAFAVRTAEAAGLTVIGFARNHSLTVYSRADRLALV